MRVKIHLNTLQLKNKFAISHGAYTYREQLLVQIDASGCSGFGETVAIDYYGVDIQQLKQEAIQVLPSIEKLSTHLSHKEFYDQLLVLIPHNPFLRCAFDCAFIDLKAQLQENPIRTYLRIEGEETVLSSITLGLGDSQELLNKRLEESWPMYKVKIDSQSRASLFEEIVNKGKAFGVDANGSLDLGQAQKVIEELKKYGAVYGEQLAEKNGNIVATKLHKENKDILLFADEGVTDLASAKRVVDSYNGFVLKLTKCGGITPVLDIIAYAKSKGKKLLAGCMTESSIGINNMLEILPLFDYADLDGAFLISNDNEVCKVDTRMKRRLLTNGRFTERVQE